VQSVTFSPDGKTLASGSHDKTIKLWRVADGKVIRTLKEQDYIVKSVAFSPDGKILVSGSEDKTIKIWRVATGEVIRTLAGHEKSVNTVAFNPDGKILASGSHDKTIKLWRVDNGEVIRTLTGHKDYVQSVAFNPDGVFLATCSINTIKLWQVTDGKPIRTLWGHEGVLNSVAFSPDGVFLASGSGDKTIRIWDIPWDIKIESIIEKLRAIKEDKFLKTQERAQRIRKLLAKPIMLKRASFELGLYDADNEACFITILGKYEEQVKVPRAVARSFKKDPRHLVCQIELRVTPDDEVICAGGYLDNTLTDERYELVRAVTPAVTQATVPSGQQGPSYTELTARIKRITERNQQVPNARTHYIYVEKMIPIGSDSFKARYKFFMKGNKSVQKTESDLSSMNLPDQMTLNFNNGRDFWSFGFQAPRGEGYQFSSRSNMTQTTSFEVLAEEDIKDRACYKVRVKTSFRWREFYMKAIKNAKLPDDSAMDFFYWYDKEALLEQDQVVIRAFNSPLDPSKIQYHDPNEDPVKTYVDTGFTVLEHKIYQNVPDSVFDRPTHEDINTLDIFTGLTKFEEYSADNTGPTVEILEPAGITRGIAIVSKGREVKISGIVRDESGIAYVRVNNQEAFLKPLADGVQFMAEVSLKTGDNKITVEAMDTKENKSTQAFTIKREGKPAIPIIEKKVLTLEEKLKKLKDLYDKELISKEEYDEQRKKILKKELEEK